MAGKDWGNGLKMNVNSSDQMLRTRYQKLRVPTCLRKGEREWDDKARELKRCFGHF